MFLMCENFDQDLSKWKVMETTEVINIFKGTRIWDVERKWFKMTKKQYYSVFLDSDVAGDYNAFVGRYKQSSLSS
jgi:hypothetical protein